ncbi:hypothetical protein J4420_03550 [Candidatus Woesearchaeota archaeon]|nr:hypothetical protein [Candidatus Woesearchaeota archaeon]
MALEELTKNLSRFRSSFARTLGLASLVLSLSAGSLYSCGSENGNKAPTSASSVGCTKDSDCKGDRLCLNHQCAYPNQNDASNNENFSPSQYDAGNNENAVPCDSHASQRCYQSDVYWVNSCGNLEDIAQNCGDNQYCNNAECVQEVPQCSSHSSKQCYAQEAYWVDSCGTKEELSQRCSADQNCQNGQCVQKEPQCTANASKVCYDSDVYWKDSCGNLGGVAESCGQNQYCDNARCVDQAPQCVSHSSKQCNNDDVYWVNSCGNLEGIAESCGQNQYCDNARCEDQAPQCQPHASTICFNGDAYWQDSCGDRQEIAENCAENQVCDQGQCICSSHQATVCIDRQLYWQDSCGNREEIREDCEQNDQYCINNQCVQRFNILGDGTIRDNSTGYTWFQSPLQVQPAEGGPQHDYLTTEAEAIALCNLAPQGFGFTLPSSAQLRGIKTGIAGQCQLYPEFQGECSAYWAQDSCRGNQGLATVVDFSSQNVANFCGDLHADQHYARCVRNR